MTTPEFLSKLEHVRTINGGWMARCPAHADTNPSLSVSEGKGKILLKCQAGCETPAVVAALGLTMRDLFTDPKPNSNGNGRRIVEIYDYKDESGKLLFQVVRYEPKDFRQRRPDGKGGWVWHLDCKNNPKCTCNPKLPAARRVLYNLPAVLGARSVLVVEGEKDVEKARTMELTATCNPHGAGKWSPEYSESLRGKHTAIVCDADEPDPKKGGQITGLEHGRDVARSLIGVAASVRLIEALPQGKDFTDWAEKAGTYEALLKPIREAPELTPADIEKWTKPSVDKPASGRDALSAAFEYVTRFVSLSEAQARIVALWIAHTHCFEAADCTPYLSINSAEKQSGKTRLLEVLELLVAKPWMTGRVSPAVLMRKIQAENPTLLLDESDTAFGSEKEYAEALRGALNTGYRRGGVVSCCVGQGSKITFADFSTFCPKAIAGIGKLPDTVEDRSIPIRLKREPRGKVERFRKRDADPGASKISANLAAWGAENIEKLRQARPEIPSQLSDRQADVSEPLLAIADLAAGNWPQAARRAIVELCTRAQVDDDSLGVKLLSDIRQVFAEKEVDEMSSKDLCECLAQIETSPWGEWSKGKPLSAMKLAHRLKPFEVYPGQIRNGQQRGYRLPQFHDVFARYLPSNSPIPPSQGVKVSETQYSCGSDANFKVSNENPPDTLKNAVSSSNDAPLRHLDTLKAGEREMGDKKGNLHGQHVAENQGGLTLESGPAGWEI